MSNNHSLPVTLANSDSLQESIWARIEQESYEPDAPTKAEVAELIDNIFELEPCTKKEDLLGTGQAKDVWPSWPGASEEEKASAVASSAASVFGLPACDEVDGSFETKLNIYRSHVCRDYVLRVTNGTLGNMERITEEIGITIPINGKSHTLDLPIACKRCDQEKNVCLDKEKVECDKPIRAIFGSTITFSKYVETATFKYKTEYDQYSLIVPGVEDGGVGQCRAFCFYEDLTVDLNVEPPQTDDDNRLECLNHTGGGGGGSGDDDGETKKECFERTYIEERCRCTNEIENESHRDEAVGCRGEDAAGTIYEEAPEREYIDCGGDGWEGKEFDYYEKMCCEPWPWGGSPPQCEKIYSDFKGGAGLSEETVAYYKRKYGEDNVSFVGVGPDDGRCGTAVEEQIVHPKSCCEDVSPLSWDYDNSASVISRNSAAVVGVTGGKLPIKIKVRGEGFYLDPALTVREGESDERLFYIYTDDVACGGCQVSVTDGCTSVDGHIDSTEGVWVFDRNVPFDECPISGEGTWGSQTSGGNYNVYTIKADGVLMEIEFSCAGCTVFRGCASCYEHPTLQIPCDPPIPYTQYCNECTDYSCSGLTDTEDNQLCHPTDVEKSCMTSISLSGTNYSAESGTGAYDSTNPLHQCGDGYSSYGIIFPTGTMIGKRLYKWVCGY